ncbi:helix-turn-helix transcriptional regulator [Sedimentibacter sp. zth1]|uniref:helix-turn-helix domain-containing protein n=1 Tax=Sedimentibacter sp. zth1 TaxID=2816908 RepID=UPI001A919B8C|nr:helix-turn-helix transcriptional regulator [Sedimentibacter sp. zth1]QSX05125.1 helix-turn-helix transcriptional regulator [Sedimentibacter sp. zth1]
MINNNLGKRLKQARLELKMTQKDLAGDFITRNMLSQIENGVANPSIKTIEYLSKTLKKPISYFIEPNYVENNTDNTNKELIDIAFKMYRNKKYDKCKESLDKFFKCGYDQTNTTYELSLLYWSCNINLGIIKFNENKILESKSLILNAYKYEPKIMILDNALKAESLMVMSKIYLALNNIEKAKEMFDSYTSIINNHINKDDEFFIKCELLLKSNNMIECKKYLELESSFKIKETQKYNFIMGVVYYENKEYNLAIEYFTKSIDLNKGLYTKDTDLIYKHIADCYSNLQQYDKAYEFMNKIYQNKTRM